LFLFVGANFLALSNELAYDVNQLIFSFWISQIINRLVGMMQLQVFTLCLITLHAALAFQLLKSQRKPLLSSCKLLPDPAALTTSLVAIEPSTSLPLLRSYISFWVDLFRPFESSVPAGLIHWGHGTAMSTVLLAMGSTGSSIRLLPSDSKVMHR
jgi:hypothetical protein